jgi:hypothetical protein
MVLQSRDHFMASKAQNTTEYAHLASLAGVEFFWKCPVAAFHASVYGSAFLPFVPAPNAELS